MSTVLNFLRQFSVTSVLRKGVTSRCFTKPLKRFYADTPKPDPNTKQVVAQGTENEQRVRVRRARASDVPRVLRFVRDHVRLAFPALASTHPPHAQHMIMLNDFVARALSQGHSMLAEQQETRRGWPQILGLALSSAICPWDAALLERWARCVRCPRARHLMHFTAHCIRAPALHDKYRVRNILQVLLVVPQDKPNSSEIIQVLAKNSIQRGKDAGFPLIRFDVTNEFTSKSLEGLQLKKEWQMSYEILPGAMTEKDSPMSAASYQPHKPKSERSRPASGNFIAVYTALSNRSKPAETGKRP